MLQGVYIMKLNEAIARISELEAQLVSLTEAAAAAAQAAADSAKADSVVLVESFGKGAVASYRMLNTPDGKHVWVPKATEITGPVTITGITFGVKAKVERKKLADMTPAEKAAHARSLADAAAKRAAELEAALAPATTSEPEADIDAE